MLYFFFLFTFFPLFFFIPLHANNQNSNKQNGRLPGESLQFVRREEQQARPLILLPLRPFYKKD
jgi:hypothetical protein